jgi:hypothetical protein
MKKYFLSIGLATLLVTGFSCKTKDKDKATENTTTTTTIETPTTTAPVVVATDDALRQGVMDATKDVKGLQATVQDGVVMLSGTISKEDNMRVTPTLNSLNPKRIDRTNLKVQ